MTSPSHPPVEPKRILIVDDEAAFGEILAQVLGEDHQVQAVRTGLAALERIESGPPYDLILCDLMMPGMTGMDLHAHLLERHPAVAARMVFVTGGAMTERSRRFLDQPAIRVFEKPLDLVTLRHFISDLA